MDALVQQFEEKLRSGFGADGVELLEAMTKGGIAQCGSRVGACARGPGERRRADYV